MCSWDSGGIVKKLSHSFYFYHTGKDHLYLTNMHVKKLLFESEQSRNISVGYEIKKIKIIKCFEGKFQGFLPLFQGA